jgi:hypothetical protein
MKTTYKTALYILIGLLTNISLRAQETIISKTALPVNSQSFLKFHFAGKEPVSVIKDKEFLSTEYKVQYKENIEVEFDKKGNWKEINGNHSAIPTSMIPKAIISYITTNYAAAKITKIEKDNKGYEVKLNNDLELKFDSKGKFLRIDD